MPAAIDGLDGALSSPTTLVASGGDVNGDGYADLLYRGGSGHAYVFNGGPNGIANMAAPSVMLKSVDVIAGAGDVDGDGYGDVVVANLGTVSIYYGRVADCRRRRGRCSMAVTRMVAPRRPGLADRLLPPATSTRMVSPTSSSVRRTRHSFISVAKRS
jgi:hypothetical protein